MSYVSFYSQGYSVPDTCQDFINISWMSEWISEWHQCINEIGIGHRYHGEGGIEVVLKVWEECSVLHPKRMKHWVWIFMEQL